MSLPPTKDPVLSDYGASKGSNYSRRSVLGRGLENLFPASPLQELDHLLVEIEKLTPNPHQPRKVFNKEALKDLSESIKRNGLIQPIVARRVGTKLEIIAGERRWKAAALAGLSEVPVRVWNKNEKQSAVLALIENLQRQNLNPIDLAEGYKKIIKDQNLTQEQLADKLAIPRASLANQLRLLNLTPSVKQWVREEKLSTAHAKLLLKEKDPIQQSSMAEYFISHSTGVREAEKILQKTKLKKVKSSSLALSNTPPWCKQALKKIQEKHGIKTKLCFQKKGGVLLLRFYSEKELKFLLNFFLK